MDSGGLSWSLMDDPAACSDSALPCSAPANDPGAAAIERSQIAIRD